ncbi:MAG: nitric oxide reductase activation protein NorD [Solirubrobacterales bacterium]
MDAIYPQALAKAERLLSPEGVAAWQGGVERMAALGRGQGPVLAFLDAVPDAAVAADESIIAPAAETAAYLAAVPELAVEEAFLSVLPAVARRVEDATAVRAWFSLARRMAQLARPGLAPLIDHLPHLLEMVGIAGLARWIEFGISTYKSQPDHVALFFALETADSQAALQRQRHGTLLVDVERQLRFTLRAFWDLDVQIRAFTPVGEQARRPHPFIDKQGFHFPDVLDDAGGVSALDRYRAMAAHLAAHRLWSRPYLADNYSQLQHLAIEVFEDTRVERLAAARHPGLLRLWRRLHPIPRAGAVPEGYSTIRHRLARLSRALLDPEYRHGDPVFAEFIARFEDEMAKDPLDPDLSARLGVALLPRIRTPDFREPRIWFEDTVVPYRDDNRWIWRFLEDTDSKDDFHSDHGTEEPPLLDMRLPVHYPEWDAEADDYRPDWTTVYETTPRIGDGAEIDRLLDRHQALARRIRQVIDRLKPQHRRRVRGQASGDELDLDGVVRAAVELKAGREPDLRIYQHHVPDGRDIAVLLLLDLSQSLNDKVPGGETTLLQLGQEATALLAWAVERLGDAFAIAGFASKSRHQVRYVHFKEFEEPWDPVTKGRLAAMEAGLATRMGAALRHAGSILDDRREAKKLLLLLSDGEPADIDVDDDDYLKADTHMAVGELRARGIATFCMTLDTKADAYVADVFGKNGYTVVDQIGRLPEKLTRLFLSLTK